MTSVIAANAAVTGVVTSEYTNNLVDHSTVNEKYISQEKAKSHLNKLKFNDVIKPEMSDIFPKDHMNPFDYTKEIKRQGGAEDIMTIGGIW